MPLPKPNPGSTDSNSFGIELPDVIEPQKYIRAKGGRPLHRDMSKNKKRGWYSDAKKMEAACAYAVAGNSKRVSEITNVPESTIRTWKNTEWWHEIMFRIKEEKNDEFDSKLTGILDKTIEGINDRLDNGDYIYDTRRGELVRKPVTAKELAIVTAIAVDKRQLLRGEPTSRVQQVSENERLVRLSEEFKKFKQAKEIESDALRIEEESYAIEEGKIEEDHLPEYQDGDESGETPETGDSDSSIENWQEQEEETLTINQIFSE